jgi:ribonuclease P protein component
MLKKENRLSDLKFKTKSQNFDTSLFKIKVFSNGGDALKFAFVVSKKIDKRAVVRNKTKRVLRNAAKSILKKTKNGENIIIFAKTAISFSQEEEAQKLLEQVFKKAELLK